MTFSVIDMQSDEPPVRATHSEELVVDLDGFEGPLDLLLDLARQQKVDLKQISISRLAEQYLAFIESARSLRIELAAEYLVMASWLALLKSRLLIPSPQEETPEAELASRMAFRLMRLDAMQGAARSIMDLTQKGQSFFGRGDTENVSTVQISECEATVLDLMQAYARLRSRDQFQPYSASRPFVLSVEEALENLRGLIADAAEWCDLRRFLPDDCMENPSKMRTAVASHFAASLELTKSGDVELRQGDPFGPIELRRKALHDER